LFRRDIFSLLKRKKEKSELEKALFSFKKAFYVIGIASGIINILYLTPSIYMLQVYDRVMVSRSVNTLVMISIIVFFAYIFMGIMQWMRSQIFIRISNAIDKKLNERIFSVAFFNALYGSSGRASQAFSDFTTVRQFVTGNGAFAFFDIPWTPIYIIVIFMVNTTIGSAAVFAVITMFFMAWLTEVVSKKDLSEANKYFRDSQAFANINFRNAEAIYAMGMTENVRKHWYSRYINFLKLQTKASTNASAVSSLTRALRMNYQSLFGYGLSAYFALKGELTPGMIVAMAILIGRAMQPVDLAIGVWRQFINARDAYKRLEELLYRFPPKEEKMSLPPPKGHVRVANLVAVPPGSNKIILRNISFDVKPGEVIGIIGPVASGKSTLAKMLVGVWPPHSGSVRLDGVEISSWDREEVGKYIGYLPQDIELLDGTIAENIARFGEIDSQKVIEAAKIAGIHEMILQFPGGYEAKLGEGGLIISGGQKQRIALARAIYGDPTLIVLDEPNSNLDELGERSLKYAIMTLKKREKTVFMITHRTSILTLTDKIIFLLNGTLYMFGKTNEVLLALKKMNQQTLNKGSQDGGNLKKKEE